MVNLPAELESLLLSVGFSAVQCHYAERLWLIMSARKRAAEACGGAAHEL